MLARYDAAVRMKRGRPRVDPHAIRIANVFRPRDNLACSDEHQTRLRRIYTVHQASAAVCMP